VNAEDSQENESQLLEPQSSQFLLGLLNYQLFCLRAQHLPSQKNAKKGNPNDLNLLHFTEMKPFFWVALASWWWGWGDTTGAHSSGPLALAVPFLCQFQVKGHSNLIRKRMGVQ